MGLLDTFLGKTGKKIAGQTLAYNKEQATTGYDNTKNYLSQGYASAQGRLDPYSEQGRTANTAYTNLLGLNGADAQKSATAAYQGSNPYLASTMDMQTKALDRRAAATGQFGSGLNALAKSRVVDETANRDYSDYMGRLQGLMAQGYTADQALAALDSGHAENMTGVEGNYRNALAGHQSQYGKDYVAADTAGLQNILGLVGTGLNAFGMVGGGAKPAAGQATAPASNNFFNWLGK
jgi:hypothetical protein